jgi:hypothetical protein
VLFVKNEETLFTIKDWDEYYLKINPVRNMEKKGSQISIDTDTCELP